MLKVRTPREMNETFARAFNSGSIDNLLALYEPTAVLRNDGTGKSLTGQNEIATGLQELLQAPGTMVSKNNFCIEHDGLALLRADWALVGDNEAVIASGSSAEVVRRQTDGSWLYIIDHAAGASLPRII